MLGIGLLLGGAGASFAIALPIASAAYPSTHQGLAMGVAAIGNSGVLVATFFAPRLAQSFGWQNAFGIMIIPVFLVSIIFWLIVLQIGRIKTFTTTTPLFSIVVIGILLLPLFLTLCSPLIEDRSP